MSINGKTMSCSCDSFAILDLADANGMNQAIPNAKEKIPLKHKAMKIRVSINCEQYLFVAHLRVISTLSYWRGFGLSPFKIKPNQ